MSSLEEDNKYLELHSSLLTWIEDSAVWIPRVLGTVTVVSSACMIGTAWKRRGHIFHRLILGMAINLFVCGVFLIYGNAAVPEDGSSYPGYGSTSTCTIQGFFIHFGWSSALLYFSFFSVYSYMCVPNNFQVSRFGWVEKYIHFSVPLYPLASAIVALSSQGFNATPFGFCFTVTKPFFCGISDDIPCKRGSQAKTLDVMMLFADTFVLLFPTVIMAALYWKVKQNQSNIRLEARSVANQAFVYLLMLYWVLTPVLIFHTLRWWIMTSYGKALRSIVGIVALINMQCFGLFSLMVYRYFSTGTYYRQDTIIGESIRNKAMAKEGEDVVIESNTTATEKYSFNIFDGTNAGGVFAEFIYDGDEEDEAINEQETEHWSGMQGL